MLFKNNRPVGNKKFESYEQCRQWARKLARKQPMPETPALFNGFGAVPLPADLSRWLWRTPTLSDYGFSIRAV
jgi:hypothetical protein